uniref:Early endosome antigen 1 n=1 Tax=Anthurium amnicola TaxID=1678845 RepID=A0A1D1Z168_9ARAE
MNDPSRTTNRRFGIWQPPGVGDSMGFGNPGPVFAAAAAAGGQPGRVNWKGRKAGEKRKNAAAAVAGAASGQKPPALGEVQPQNRGKPFFRFYPRRKPARFAPFAPRNTTSFIIRAKKAGGIASLVSPCPVTPAILPTPRFSPSREHLVDMAKEEWGVDGYGSMTGLIRLRPPTAKEDDDGDDMGEGSSESEVEEHAEVERRLDHDLSRFEMVYPSTGEEHALESRVDEQDAHIARLQEEILTLREKLLLMEREMGDVRRRLQLLEDNIYDDGGNTSMNLVVEAWNEGGGGDVSSEQSVGD